MWLVNSTLRFGFCCSSLEFSNTWKCLWHCTSYQHNKWHYYYYYYLYYYSDGDYYHHHCYYRYVLLCFALKSERTAITHPHCSNSLFQSRARNRLLRGTSWMMRDGSMFFFCGVSVSIPKQSTWDLWCTKWHWGRLFYTHIGFPLSISFRRAPQSSSSTCHSSQKDKRAKNGKLSNVNLEKAVPWLGRLVSSLLQRRAWFDLRAAHVRFVVDKVALGLGLGFFKYFRISLSTTF